MIEVKKENGTAPGQKVRFSLQLKFILFISLLIISIVAIMSLYFINSGNTQRVSMFSERGAMLAKNLAYNGEYGALISNKEMLLGLAKAAMRETDILYTRFEDAKGKALVSVQKNDAILPKEVSGKIPASTLATTEVAMTRFADKANGVNIYDFAVPIKTYSDIGSSNEMLNFEYDYFVPKKERIAKVIGYVRVGFSSASLDRAMERSLRAALLLTVFAFLIGVSISTVLYRMIIKPLDALEKGTERLSSGDYDYRINILTNDEIGGVAGSFNEMADRLKEYSTRLEEKVAERTKELLSKKDELEQANKKLTENKMAMLNMMQDMKEAQEQLKTLFGQEQVHLLQIQEANDKKTSFVSDVSHELRTPLASIKGFISTIRSDKDMDENTREDFMRIVEEEADRLARIIEQLLDISRIESGRLKMNPKAFQLTDLINKNIETIRGQAKLKDITIEQRSQELLPMVYADEDKTAQIIVNLLSNSIKYNKQGGKVIISTGKNDGCVKVDVQDTGIGISEKDLPHMFEKFFRADSAASEAPGTGLGLALTKSLVEVQGGLMTMESKFGEGSKFSFTLPTHAFGH